MKSALDSSVIVSALCAGDPDHQASRKVLLTKRHSVHAHALAETFSTLTGGRLGFRVPAPDAAKMLRQQIAPMHPARYESVCINPIHPWEIACSAGL